MTSQGAAIQQLAQEVSTDRTQISSLSQRVATEEATTNAALGALANRSGCTPDRDVDGNSWYLCQTTNGSVITVP